MTQPTDKDVMKAALAMLDGFLDSKETAPKLTNREIDALEAYLDAHANDGYMHLELLDGFMCALINGPMYIPPEKYLPHMFGGAMPVFKDQEESNQIMDLLNRHWEHIESTMQVKGDYYPFLYADPDGKCSANQWAYGFALGMELCRDQWMGLVQSSKEDGLLTPILTLYTEGVPELSGDHILSANEREETVKKLVANMPEIYEHFKESREKSKNTISVN